MPKIIPFPKKRRGAGKRAAEPEPVDQEVIARMRAIGDHSSGLCLDTDEELISPDGELLGVTSAALSLLVEAQRASDAEQGIFHDKRSQSWRHWGDLSSAERAEAQRLRELEREKVARAREHMRRARKIRARTGAGIYAKALLVRDARVGAPILAKSMAEDLIALPALRAMLWPADVEGQP